MGEKAKIWVVDDERIIRVTLADDLREAGFMVKEFSDPIAVLSSLRDECPDIIITDLKMPNLNGIELLCKIKDLNSAIHVIVMTAHGSIENAVDAMKLGAYDYILKPFKTDEIFLVLDKICELRKVKQENKELRKKIKQQFDFTNYIGDRLTNEDLFDLIRKVSITSSTVLIIGETGTGKELITNIVHYNSPRKDKTFVKVSCAILSKEIFESELFGHVKGAFTGADFDKKGRFELADGGTLYLDDIDDIPIEMQVKLLRAIEQREIEKVGSAKSIPIDVRIIASTKKDLRKLVNEGLFREDLFYRLNIFPINLKPLRERQKDISPLIQHFIAKYSYINKVNIDNFALEFLVNYNWPGNIRELKNLMERLIILATDGNIHRELIPLGIAQPIVSDSSTNLNEKSLDQAVSDIEILLIKNALKNTNNNKTKAAESLGLPTSTLRTKMDKYNIC